jgi:hypothetical protein
MRRMEQTSVMRVFRSMFALVTLVAGIAGIVMLVAPADTDDYFSWPIGPTPLAATVGSFYVASAIVFALTAARGGWFHARGLCVSVLGLTVPTIVSTIYDRDVFDFGRWQAVAWVVLFVVSPIAFSIVLIAQRRLPAPPSNALPRWGRALLSALAVGYAALGVAAWIDPVAVGDHWPFPMGALSGRFVGSWAAFLATLAAYSAIRNRRPEAFIPAVALTLWPIAALLAALRSFDDLVSSTRRGVYLAVLVVLAMASGSLIAAAQERNAHAP